MKQEILDQFIAICGTANVVTGSSEKEKYERDETLGWRCPFDVLIKPKSAIEISEILKLCSKHGIPVTPRGGGSGVTGGALAVLGGMIVSLERMNKISSINTRDMYVVADAGVITADLCEAVAGAGMFFPVAPSSAEYSFIGGNVAENAGCMRSSKYGSTGRYVLNLEVVLPNGDIFWTGANVKKNVTGLNLTQLFVGSEGVLGIISQVVYRLLPAAREEIVLLFGFETVSNAFGALSAIAQSALLPSFCELICDNAIQLTSSYLNEQLPLVEKGINAHLLLGIEVAHEPDLDIQLQRTVSIVNEFCVGEILVGQSQSQKDNLLKLRMNIGKAMVRKKGYYRDLDVSVPLSELKDYIESVQVICNDYGIQPVCFGHALDGNIHTMLTSEYGTEIEEEVLLVAVGELYRYAVSKGGVITGEHGVGILQKAFMKLQYPESCLALMGRLKKCFDPENILNPGKCF